MLLGFHFLFFVCLPQNSFLLVWFLLIVKLNNRGMELPRCHVTRVARQVEPGTWDDHDARVKPATSPIKQPQLHRSLEHSSMAVSCFMELVSQSSKTSGSKTLYFHSSSNHSGLGHRGTLSIILKSEAWALAINEQSWYEFFPLIISNHMYTVLMAAYELP